MKNTHLFTTGQVRTLSRLSKKQIEQWMSAQVVVPTGTGTPWPGKGRQHRWTEADAILLSLVADIARATGMPLQHLRVIAERLRTHLDQGASGLSTLSLRSIRGGVQIDSKNGSDAIMLVIPMQALLHVIKQRVSEISAQNRSVSV